jgi:glutathione S-transferase
VRREVEAFEDALATTYAVHTRRIAYDLCFRTLEVSLPYNAGRAPRWQVAAFHLGRSQVRRLAGSYLVVNAETRCRAEDETDRTLDSVAERLGDGRRYLYGEAIGAADVAFAAFSAPVLMPARYPVRLPALDQVPGDVAARVEARRRHPAGQFAMRLYDERPAPRGRYERPLYVEAMAGRG